MNFAFCIMGALMARERHGVGQKVETSQLGAMIQFQSADILAPWHTGEQRDDGLPARVNDVVLVSPSSARQPCPCPCRNPHGNGFRAPM